MEEKDNTTGPKEIQGSHGDTPAPKYQTAAGAVAAEKAAFAALGSTLELSPDYAARVGYNAGGKISDASKVVDFPDTKRDPMTATEVVDREKAALKAAGEREKHLYMELMLVVVLAIENTMESLKCDEMSDKSVKLLNEACSAITNLRRKPPTQTIEVEPITLPKKEDWMPRKAE